MFGLKRILSGLSQAKRDPVTDVQAQMELGRQVQYRRQEQLAAGGDMEAEYGLGSRLRWGINCPEDHVLAASYLGRAAGKGHPDAQYLLASMYKDGLGVEKDLPKALSLYEQSASNPGQFRISAVVALGRMHERGCGSSVDLEKALACYRAAGDDTEASLHLGDMYRDGRGVPRDDAEAIRLYRNAARAEGQAIVNLGKMYLEGRGLDKDIHEAHRLFCMVVDSRLKSWDSARAAATKLRDLAQHLLRAA